MKQTSSMRKIVSGVATLVLLLTGGLIGQSSSQAAGLPTVRVQSPDFNPANETFDIDRMTQWYAPGGRSYYKYVGAGSTITLTYLVTTDGSTPAADTNLNFYVNAPWSVSKATWEVNGKAVGRNVDGTAGLKVDGKTDSTGKISFTIKNTNSVDSAMDIPANETQARALEAIRIYGNMKLVIEGIDEKLQIIDFVSLDVTKAAAETIPSGTTPTPAATSTPTPAATSTPTPAAPVKLPSMRLKSPEFGATNSVDTTDAETLKYYSAKTRAYYTYIAAGTTLTLKYLVTSDGTTPFANKEVTLQVNAPYSNSKANWLHGSTKIGVPAAETASGADLKGTTNANGEVTFIIKNTDTTVTTAKPATPISPATLPRFYGTFKPIISGYDNDKDADLDLVTFEVYAAPKPAAKKTTITCVKGKTTKKVTDVNPKCPTGYKKK